MLRLLVPLGGVVSKHLSALHYIVFHIFGHFESEKADTSSFIMVVHWKLESFTRTLLLSLPVN